MGNDLFGSAVTPGTPVGQSRWTDNSLTFLQPPRAFGHSRLEDYQNVFKSRAGAEIVLLLSDKTINSQQALAKLLVIFKNMISHREADMLSVWLEDPKSTNDYAMLIRSRFSAKVIKNKIIPVLDNVRQNGLRKEMRKYQINAAIVERRETAVMVVDLKELMIKRTGNKNPGDVQLADFDPDPKSDLKERLLPYINNLTSRFNRGDFKSLIRQLQGFRAFLKTSKDVFTLFQILKWIRESISNTDLATPIIYEIYLETYMAIVEHAVKKLHAAKYINKIPQEDVDFFQLAFTHERWKVYQSDYVLRLLYACKNMEQARKITEFMFMMHLTASVKNLRLVSFAETFLIREAFSKNIVANPLGLAAREVNLVWGRATTTRNLKIGNSLDGFHVYYITLPHELPLRFNALQAIFLKHPDIDSVLFEVDYLTIHQRQEGDFYRKLYKDNKHIISASQNLFKFLAYMPVLVEAGIAGFAYEVVINEIVAPQAGALAGKIDSRLELPVNLLAGIVAPKPPITKGAGADDAIAETHAGLDHTIRQATPTDDIARTLTARGATEIEIQIARGTGVDKTIAQKVANEADTPSLAETARSSTDGVITPSPIDQNVTLVQGFRPQGKTDIGRTGLPFGISKAQIGKGFYFGLREKQAVTGAGARITGSAQGKVIEVELKREDLGLIVDVRKDGEHRELWDTYLKKNVVLPKIFGRTITNEEAIQSGIKKASEVFEDFLKTHGLTRADTIFVSGHDKITAGAVMLRDLPDGVIAGTQVIIRTDEVLGKVNKQIQEAFARGKHPGAQGIDETSIDVRIVAPAARANDDLDRFSEAFDTRVDPNFHISAIADQSFDTTLNLRKGNFGERMAAESLAASGHKILMYKPGIEGTNQGGIDIVTFFNGKVYFFDNKAVTTGKNVASVSALEKNFGANLNKVLNELHAIRRNKLWSPEDLDIINKAIMAIRNNQFKRVVTNASFIKSMSQVSGNITPHLLRKNILFIDFFR